jgi:hypothetical protein
MAGKYGSASITITYDASPGGSGQIITNYVLTMGAVKISSELQKSNAFGDAWEEFLPTGLNKMEKISLTGFWDTTATTSPHVVFIAPDDGPQDATRTLVIVFGDSKTMTVETYLQSYSVIGKNGNLTEFAAEIQPTGAAVWS